MLLIIGRSLPPGVRHARPGPHRLALRDVLLHLGLKMKGMDIEIAQERHVDIPGRPDGDGAMLLIPLEGEVLGPQGSPSSCARFTRSVMISSSLSTCATLALMDMVSFIRS